MDPFAAGDAFYRLNRIFLPNIDHVVRTQFGPQIQPRVARSCEDHGLRPQGLAHGHTHEPDRARARDNQAFPCNQPAQGVEAIHGRARGNNQCSLFITHLIRHMNQRIDMIDRILCKAAIRGEAIRTVPLVVLAIVQAIIKTGRVHAHTASFAASAAGMDLHCNAIPDSEFVHARSELDHGAHVFMARREILIERETASDPCRQPFGQDLHVRTADRNGVNPHQHLGGPGFRNGFFHQTELFRIVEDPCLHGLWNR